MFSPPEFDYQADDKMWRATTGAAARDVLSCPALNVTDLPGYYQLLADEIGRDFPLIRYYSGYLLLTNDGPRHAELRKLAAAQFNKSGLAQRQARAALIAAATQRFATQGEFDVMAEIVRPIARSLTEALAGLSADFVASDILSPRRSLRKNHALEARLAVMQDKVAALFPDESEDAQAIRVTLALLGTEPLTAGLGAALLALLQENTGQRLCDIAWPDAMLEPAVKHAVRFAPASLPAETCPMRGFHVELRMLSDPALGGKSGEIFGIGAHSCMGRGMSIIVWRELVACLSSLKTRITLIGFEPATHWLFNAPNRIDVRITDDPR